MSLYPYFIIGGSVLIDLFLVWICYTQYRKNKFTPSLLLLLFYLLFCINDLIYFVVFFIPETSLALATLLMDITIYLGFMTFPLLIIFFESLYKPKLSFWGIFVMVISSFMIGFTLRDPLPTFYVRDYGWNQTFPDNFIVFSAIYLVFILCAIIFQFYRYSKFSTTQKKRTAKITIFGLFLAFLGEFLTQAFDLIYLKQISLTLGFFILSIAFYRDPESFILTPIKMMQFLILDKKSGLILFKSGTNFSVISQGLNASTIIQQEIAGASKPAEELIYGDRIFLIEHQQGNNRDILGVLIVDKKVIGLRHSLKYATSKFILKYSHLLDSHLDEIGKYSSFSAEIYQIFNYFSIFSSNEKTSNKIK